ncbi:MAG: tyrosine--tRNA ligase [Candidatus Levybacteria bacterium RIFCSPHIGHO2_02_FULL_37_10]|uniref:Tyrosine--tRNA ligase n=1 Tax=candidate division WWE3 bacterium RIFCSPHIGHO2_01_FULL_35_17 TaxID=1802614 RepID=A0A1F4UR95_UNCKA|nr:MAG: tyrosine--tRNA ligase [candidate division WWE3 bacterium RIFCSPHIGHO2_01_FULL_35_17]OGH17969.1 MAG: tyrosine--tRNA ligase [Candidatus Levybacteria bacterium RIFCSPHIGHO2_02_FULL_37_10]
MSMDKVEELLTRGVEKIYPSKEELEKVLRSGKKLKIYQGFDPTGIQLHIGHMVGLRKLKQWQDLGHHVIFLIGDGTGQAGDPSGKKHAREKFLTREELRKNAVDYIKQAGKIVRFEGENPVEILFNGDWLNELKLVDILNIAGRFSLQQLLERDLFQQRIKQDEDVNLREFLYPLLQAYDSVVMEVDLELGGSDQTFNMLAGRTLIKKMKNKDKFVMTTPLLTDSRGVKIGKTEGNVIALTDKPEDLFGKIMAFPDDVIIKGFEYLTNVTAEEIKRIEKELPKGENPVDFKKKLAFEIVKELSNTQDAEKAQKSFEQTVQGKELPDDVPVFQYDANGDQDIVSLLMQTKLAASKSDAKRLIKQGGVSIDEIIIKNLDEPVTPKGGMILRVGKRKFVKIKTSAR